MDSKDFARYKKHEPFFGSWHIVRELGEGSFGKVFEIEREDFGEIYKSALKVLTVPSKESELKSVMNNGLDVESATEYFEGVVKDIVSEIVLMSKFKGTSNIVSYEDHQVIPHKDGIGWDILIRMELLTPLFDHFKVNPLRQKDVIQLGIDICNALELCQKHSIIHRDIKPENIFVSEFNDYKLGDFGIARTIEKTTSGLSKKGTYNYMAPEVYRGDEYGSSVDIYSLGITMYRLLNNNRAPFFPPYPEKVKHSDGENAIKRRMGGEQIPPPSAADDLLTTVILKACAFSPTDRYTSPVAMRQDLEAISSEKNNSLASDLDEKTHEIYDSYAPSSSKSSTSSKSFSSSKGSIGSVKPAPMPLDGTDNEATVCVDENDEIIVNPPPTPQSGEKRSKLPLILSIAGGAAALIVVLIIVVFSGDDSYIPVTGQGDVTTPDVIPPNNGQEVLDPITIPSDYLVSIYTTQVLHLNPQQTESILLGLDEENNIVERTTFDANGNQVNRVTFVRNENRIYHTYYDTSDAVSYSFMSEYTTGEGFEHFFLSTDAERTRLQYIVLEQRQSITDTFTILPIFADNSTSSHTPRIQFNGRTIQGWTLQEYIQLSEGYYAITTTNFSLDGVQLGSRTTHNFNEYGLITTIVIYTRDGRPEYRIEYFYQDDAIENKFETRYIYSIAHGRGLDEGVSFHLSERTLNMFTGDGTIISSSSYRYERGVLSHYVFREIVNGRVVAITHSNPDGSVFLGASFPSESIPLGLPIDLGAEQIDAILQLELRAGYISNFIAVRAVGEIARLDWQWVDNERDVFSDRDGNTVEFWPHIPRARVNGEYVDILAGCGTGTAPILIGEHRFVPVGFFNNPAMQPFGINASWDEILEWVAISPR